MIDPHTHLDDQRFDDDRGIVLDRMTTAGVDAAVCVGSDMPSTRRAMALALRDERVWASAGVHPHEASSLRSEDLDELTVAMGAPRVVAWGEIGLDYHYDHSPRAVQREAFARQLDAARALGKPVILHVREAHGDAYPMLRERRNGLAGVLHCYSGSWEIARQYLDLGLYISLSGSVTFKNAHNLHDVARRIPIDRLMAETDCPYLAPEPHRGQRNEPAYAVDVARRIAALRRGAGVFPDDEAVMAEFTKNIAALFGFSPGKGPVLGR